MSRALASRLARLEEQRRRRGLLFAAENVLVIVQCQQPGRTEPSELIVTSPTTAIQYVPTGRA